MIPLSYSVRSLLVRKSTSAAAGLGLGLVVFVFALVMMLSNGILASAQAAADPNVAIVMRRGSSTEWESWIDEANAGQIGASPEVAHDATGRAAVAVELVVSWMFDDAARGVSNVTMRGVSDDVLAFRRTVTIIAGRPARPGTDEVVIGKAIRGFHGLDVGRSFEMRKNRPMKVVGVFEDHGSAYESEIWGDRSVVQHASGRESVLSSVRVRLESPDRFDTFKAGIEANRQLNVIAMRDSEFYRKMSFGASQFVSVAGFGLAVLFSIGAILGAMITMHAAVAQRGREIGTLRALGFSRGQVLLSFLFESIALALLGGAIGTAASLLMSLEHITLLNFSTGSELSFKLASSPKIIAAAIAIATVMGIVGGFFPAVRAARLDPIRAMRGD